MLQVNPGQVFGKGTSRTKASVRQSRANPASRPGSANRVLGERNQAVAAVGAWVEGGRELEEHPAVRASLTEELQAEKRREDEEGLRRFQDTVRCRVAHQAQLSKKRQQLQKTYKQVESDRRFLQRFGDSAQRPSADDGPTPCWPCREPDVSRSHPDVRGVHRSAGRHRLKEQRCQQAGEGVTQVRHRLAACRMIPDEEMLSNLPGGKWNISAARDKPVSHMSETEQEVEEEEEVLENEEEEDGDDFPLTSQHERPVVQQDMKESPGHQNVAFHRALVHGKVLKELDQSHVDPFFSSDSRVLWPLDDQEELRRQHQSQFLKHRRLYMDIEREQVKYNKQQRQHLKRIARIKTEKERIRLEEERKLENLRQLNETRRQMEERELLILERLRIEEEERLMELEKRKLKKKEQEHTRFIEALRAKMKERLSQEKSELPPLCCCGSSFWDSHPDTCANNCIFHNNPKAYAQALHSALLTLELH
ncbi:coiled-coil domain-containing protein 15 [Myripristis murdjan]|uniref:Coiled-coil domain containing 15 n=1 Tax=Myripristis murdjan TaxID=586833 RepID=A0A667X029_9TELE|nr:coiled-coil domain-containing protein 15 [Myripristis murdjan]